MRVGQTPPRGGAEGRGGHARDRAGGSRRLKQPWRPARALPRPGPHAPIFEEPLGGVGERSAKAREDALRSATGAGQEGRDGGPLLCPSGGGPFLLRSSGSGSFVLARSGACLGLARALGLGLRLLARALGLGLLARAPGLGLEPSAHALGLGLGSWSLLPAWAWEHLLIGATPHSCSTSPRRTGSFRGHCTKLFPVGGKFDRLFFL